MSIESSVTLRVGHLPSLQQQNLVSVVPEDNVRRAESLMSLHCFSQLPVMPDQFTVIGAVTWESIAAARMAGREDSVTCAMYPAEVVSVDTEMRQVHSVIQRSGFIFVQDEHGVVDGIITLFDANMAVEKLTGPHLLIGEIEWRLRNILDRAYERAAIQHSSPNGRLTLGNIETSFRSRDIWESLGWRVDQQVFVDELRKVREIRNKFAHYESGWPEPLPDEECQRLSGFLDWLRRLNPAG
ncbi:CBS domain-containing protein [Spirillospora sp. NPDC029432]|uniref:CBS domain-containing protein n=1 Tax=Spirillospora sp. NPDC029432 TaxID=3154599 RepID=UPI0034540403